MTIPTEAEVLMQQFPDAEFEAFSIAPLWVLTLVGITLQLLLIYLAYIGVKKEDIFEKVAIKYDGSSFSRIIIALGPAGQAIDAIFTQQAGKTDRINTQTNKIAKFWSIDSNSNVDIICSEIPDESRPDFAKPNHRNYLRYAKFADLDSLIHIRYCLARLTKNPHIRTFTHTEYHDINTDVMILVGGPAWNENAAELQTQLPCHFERNPLGEDDPIVFNLPELEGYKFSPGWNENGELVSDIAIFSKISLEDKQSIFYVAGCLTWGVKGASKCFLDPEVADYNLEFIKNEVGEKDFTVLFEVERYGRVAKPPQFSEQQPLVLVTFEEDGFGLKTGDIEQYRGE